MDGLKSVCASGFCSNASICASTYRHSHNRKDPRMHSIQSLC